MSWANIKARGAGWLGLRLLVEGWPDVWVTDRRIRYTINANGRRVIPGLRFDGLKLSERAVLRDVWTEAKGMTFKIGPIGWGTDEDPISSFTRTPVPLGYLAYEGGTPGLDVATAHMTLDNGINAPAGFVHIATECIGVDGANNLTRAEWGTQAQRHYIIYGGGRPVQVPVYAYPPTMEGRRCTLYAYGEADNFNDDGTAIWRGIVTRPPRMDRDGISWTIQADPITKALEQKVASAETLEYKIRGVYHSHAMPMAIGWRLRQTGDRYPYVGTTVKVFGFYETQQDWITAVLTQLATLFSTEDAFQQVFTHGTYDERSGAPRFHLVLTYPSPGPMSAVWLEVQSVMEGDLALHMSTIVDQNGRTFTLGDNWSNKSTNDYGYYPGYSADLLFGDSSQSYICASMAEADRPAIEYPVRPARGAVGYPRFAVIGSAAQVALGVAATQYFADDPSNTAPPNRIYLNVVDGLAVGQILIAKNGDAMVPLKINALAPAVGDRYIEVDILSGDAAVYFDDSTTFVPLRVFVTDSSIYDFANEVIAESPNANDGDTPYVPASDMDTTGLLDALDSSPVDDYWRHRNYAFVKPVPIKTIICEELKALGWMVRTESDGRIGFTALPIVAANQDSVASITEDDICLPAEGTEGSWPYWEAQSDGLVNIVQAKMGYRPLTDDFDALYEYSIREISSIAEHKSQGKGTAQLAPRSTPAWWNTIPGFAKSPLSLQFLGRPITAEIVAGWVAAYLRVLSMDYATVTISVPFKFIDLLIGDIVDVTSAHIPNGLGGRGVTARKAAVVGREWPLDPAQSSVGKLTLYFPREISGGYTPTGRITGQTSLGSNQWRLTFDQANTFNLLWSTTGNGFVAFQFAVGEKVEVIQVDALAPSFQTGTVTAQTATTLDVQFNGTWTPGSLTWNLKYTNEQVSMTARQRTFVFVADTNRERLDGTYARVFI